MLPVGWRVFNISLVLPRTVPHSTSRFPYSELWDVFIAHLFLFAHGLNFNHKQYSAFSWNLVRPKFIWNYSNEFISDIYRETTNHVYESQYGSPGVPRIGPQSTNWKHALIIFCAFFFFDLTSAVFCQPRKRMISKKFTIADMVVPIGLVSSVTFRYIFQGKVAVQNFNWHWSEGVLCDVVGLFDWKRGWVFSLTNPLTCCWLRD